MALQISLISTRKKWRSTSISETPSFDYQNQIDYPHSKNQYKSQIDSSLIDQEMEINQGLKKSIKAMTKPIRNNGMCHHCWQKNHEFYVPIGLLCHTTFYYSMLVFRSIMNVILNLKTERMSV